MDTKLFILYSTDQWHTYDSQELEAVCTSLGGAIDVADRIAKAIQGVSPLSVHDKEMLVTERQTQGRELNFRIVDVTADTYTLGTTTYKLYPNT